MRKLKHKERKWLVQCFPASRGRSQSGIWSPEPNTSVPFLLKQGPLLLIISRYVLKILVRDHFCQFASLVNFSFPCSGLGEFPCSLPEQAEMLGTGMLQIRMAQQGRWKWCGFKTQVESALDKTLRLVLQKNPPTQFKDT